MLQYCRSWKIGYVIPMYISLIELSSNRIPRIVLRVKVHGIPKENGTYAHLYLLEFQIFTRCLQVLTLYSRLPPNGHVFSMDIRQKVCPRVCLNLHRNITTKTVRR